MSVHDLAARRKPVGSVDDLFRSIVREEVRAAVAEAVGEHRDEGTVLLDREQLAERLGVSVPSIDRLRREGCPTLKIGDVPRFELDRVLGWLRERGAK